MGYADSHADVLGCLLAVPDALRRLGVEDAHTSRFLAAAVAAACNIAASTPNGYLFNGLVEMLDPGQTFRRDSTRKRVNALIEQLAGMDGLAQGADFELRQISTDNDRFSGD
jgi:hypothetical protein